MAASTQAQPRRYHTRAQTRVDTEPLHSTPFSSTTSTTTTSVRTSSTTTTATSSTIASRKRTSSQASLLSRPSSRASSTSSSAPTKSARKSTISSATSRTSTTPSVLGPKPSTSRVTRRSSLNKAPSPQRSKPSPKARGGGKAATRGARSTPARTAASPKRAPRKKKKVTFESPQPARTPKDKENHVTSPARATTVDRDNDVEMKGGSSTPPTSPQRSVLSSSSGNTSPVRSPVKSSLLNSPEKLRSARQKTAEVDEEDELATAIPISSPMRPPQHTTRQLSPVRSVHTLLPPPKVSFPPIRSTSPVRSGVGPRGPIASAFSNVPNLAPSMVPIRPQASPQANRSTTDSDDELSTATPFSPPKRPVKSLNFTSRPASQKTENNNPTNVMNTPARRPAKSQLFGGNSFGQQSKLAPQTPSAAASSVMATPARRPMGLATAVASARKPVATASNLSSRPSLEIKFPEAEKPLVKMLEQSRPQKKPAEKPVKIKEEVDFGDLIRVPKRLSFGANQQIFALGKKQRQSLSKIPRRSSGASAILDMVDSSRADSSPTPEAMIKKEESEEPIDLTRDASENAAPVSTKAIDLTSSVSSNGNSEELANGSEFEKILKEAADVTFDSEGDVEMSGLADGHAAENDQVTQPPQTKTSPTQSKIPVPNSTRRSFGLRSADSSLIDSPLDSSSNVGDDSKHDNAVHLKRQPHGRMPVTPTMNKLPGLEMETEIPESAGRTLFGPNATQGPATGDDSFVTDIGDDTSMMEGMQGAEEEGANETVVGNFLDSAFSQPTPDDEMMKMAGMPTTQTEQIPIDPALPKTEPKEEPHPLHQPQRYSAPTTTSRIPVKFEPDSPPRELEPEPDFPVGSPNSIRAGIIPTVTLTRGKSPKSVPAVALSSSLSSSSSSNSTSPTSSKIPTDRILAGAVVYVDVHLQDGEAVSDRFSKILQSLGAKVVKQWNWNPTQTTGPNSKVGITHVVFKDGGQRTLQKVKQSKGVVNCVGIAWVIECQKQGLWVNEEGYRVDLDIKPRGGGRRRKSMEPKAALTMIDLTLDAPEPSNNEDTEMDLTDAPKASSSSRNYGGIRIKTEETMEVEIKSEPEPETALEEPVPAPAPEPRRRTLGPLNLPPPSEPILTPVLPDPMDDDDADEDMDKEVEIGDRSILISAGEDFMIPRSPSPSSSSSDSSDNEENENDNEDNENQAPLITPPRSTPVSISAPMTAPSNRVLGGQGSQMGMTPAIAERILAARRKSMQFMPKVSSPLSRQWSAKP
ncbi:hypothetical protein BJ508DRAFT_411269 [Ascobolus immersus RN42]|uniref:BRCT domain-containing protein n=1 Tax=Ascobolus immersus RN42 TaxID=1160509 RepID=A0A3N4IQW4_ASCIM|nr:hypothetical protein BJ508DRAFT_411269 [Ascobolus immersus RN42]